MSKNLKPVAPSLNWNHLPRPHQGLADFGPRRTRLSYHLEAARKDFQIRHPRAYHRLFVLHAVFTRR